jgi:hypothetical protein
MTTMGATSTDQAQNGALGQQLERIGWALFLIMVGMNVVRHLKGIRVSGFTTVLGVAAMAAGVFSIAGIDFPVFPVLLIAVGAHILYGALVPRKETR